MSARAGWLMTGCVAAVLSGFAGVAAAQNALAPPARQFELPPLENLQATRERPLFMPTRRPPAIVVAPEAAPPIVESASLPFELTGIALGEDVHIAILHNKTTNEELRLREGDKLDDWKLEQVADRYILLRGEGRRVRVWLVSNAKPPGIEVRQVNGTEDSTAAVTPAGEVDQEVVPSAPPAARAPPPPPMPPPVARRPPHPPVPPRAGIGMRPDLRRQLRRN